MILFRSVGKLEFLALSSFCLAYSLVYWEKGTIWLSRDEWKESSDVFCSLSFKFDVILKKQVQNGIASLLLGIVQNWSWTIVSTELTSYPGDPNELMHCPRSLIYNQEEFGVLKGQLNRSIFTHCDCTDRSSSFSF